MAVSLSAFILVVTSWTVTSASVSEVMNMTAQLGEDVTLSCQSPDDVNIIAVEWTRPDLEELEHVFFYRDGRFELDFQHPSFKNRVELRDREMKNGDLSVILKNVKKNDTGTYECRFKADGEELRKRAIIDDDPISIMKLKVVGPGQTDEQDKSEDPPDEPVGSGYVVGAVVGALVVIICAVAVVGVVVVKLRKQKSM